MPERVYTMHAVWQTGNEDELWKDVFSADTKWKPLVSEYTLQASRDDRPGENKTPVGLNYF